MLFLLGLGLNDSQQGWYNGTAAEMKGPRGANAVFDRRRWVGSNCSVMLSPLATPILQRREASCRRTPCHVRRCRWTATSQISSITSFNSAIEVAPVGPSNWIQPQGVSMYKGMRRTGVGIATMDYKANTEQTTNAFQRKNHKPNNIIRNAF